MPHFELNIQISESSVLLLRRVKQASIPEKSQIHVLPHINCLSRLVKVLRRDQNSPLWYSLLLLLLLPIPPTLAPAAPTSHHFFCCPYLLQPAPVTSSSYSCYPCLLLLLLLSLPPNSAPAAPTFYFCSCCPYVPLLLLLHLHPAHAASTSYSCS